MLPTSWLLLKPVEYAYHYKYKYSCFFFFYSLSWFFGRIEREQAEKLMSSATDGQFLVKESLHFPGDYVLFVRYVVHFSTF